MNSVASQKTVGVRSPSPRGYEYQSRAGGAIDREQGFASPSCAAGFIPLIRNAEWSRQAHLW